MFGVLDLRLTALACAVLLALALALQVCAQEPYTIQEASVAVYRDGVVHVKLVASIDP